MFPLQCTVRQCSQLLQPTEDALVCSAGHHFDRAKQGYWNLLQPQDRKSKHPGDADDAVLARHRWLQRGYASGLIDALRPWTGTHQDDPNRVAPDLVSYTMDLGCGEGTFGPALFADEAAGYCGIDLSKRAIKLAARRWPQATWVLANADRGLPAQDASVDRVISLFGRRPISEIQRVLSPGGVCIVAVPGEEDLIELREKVQQTGQRRSRWEAIVDEFSSEALVLAEHSTWSQKVQLDPDAIIDAMAMTYRGARHSQRSRLESIAATEVTLAAELMLFRFAD